MGDQKKEIENLLFKLYYDTSCAAALSTPDRLFSFIRKNYDLPIKKSLVEKWLSSQNTFTLHKDRRLRFRRNAYNITNIDDLWQMDLIDMQKLSRKNKGFRFILAMIDCFSKYAWCIPIKRKTPSEVVDALKIIFAKTERRPINLQSDKGREFLNTKVQTFLKENNINYYTAADPATKASICERFIRTIKALIYKYFTFTKSERYTDVLDALVFVYNNRKHRSIGMAPNSVNETNVLSVWKNLNKKNHMTARVHAKFMENDLVRVSNPKKIFDKGYKPTFSEEFFTIKQVCLRTPPVYKLIDQNGMKINGVFYEPELQKVEKA